MQQQVFVVRVVVTLLLFDEFYIRKKKVTTQTKTMPKGVKGPVYVLPPTVVDGVYQFVDCEVVQTENRGLGVFAKKDIPKLTYIPFGGEKQNRRQHTNKIKSCGKRGMADYLLELSGKTDDDSCVAYDAHPSLYEKICRGEGEKAPKYAWIGSLINHPNFGETPNCELRYEPTARTDYYPNNSSQAFMCTTVDVKKGEELLSMYGHSATLLRRSGINHDGLTDQQRAEQEQLEVKTLLKQSERYESLVKKRAILGRQTQTILANKKTKHYFSTTGLNNNVVAHDDMC